MSASAFAAAPSPSDPGFRGVLAYSIGEALWLARPPAPLSGWRRLVDDELLANGLLGLINEVGTRRPAWRPRINEFGGKTPESAHLHRPLGRGLHLPAAGPFRGERVRHPAGLAGPVITELRRWIDAGDERIGIPAPK